MERFIFNLAGHGDSKELLEILEEESYGGNISLLYTRGDDAYASFMAEGAEVRIIACRDAVNNKIAAIGACAVRTLYVNREPTRIGYLFSLKARGEYRKLYRYLHKGYAFCHEIHRDKNLDFFLMTILSGNHYAEKLLAKKRSFMPGHYFLGVYEVYALKTGMKRKPIPELRFKKCEKHDLAAVVRFLNETGRNHQFYPVTVEEDFSDENRHGPSYKDFYIIEDAGGQIAACGAVWDQAHYKQYIVKGYGGFLKVVAPFSSWLPIFGYPDMLAKPGALLKFFTLSYWAVKDNNPALFEYFVKNISSAITGYSFFVIGVHEKNILRKVLTGIPHFSYKSNIYMADWDKSRDKRESLDGGMTPYLECGTL